MQFLDHPENEVLFDGMPGNVFWRNQTLLVSGVSYTVTRAFERNALTMPCYDSTWTYSTI